MGEQEIPIFIAFVAGLLSFFSPCVLPLIPAYITFITGISIDKLTEHEFSGRRKKGRILLEILFFVMGFTIVFVALGVSATSLGSFVIKNQKILRIAGGVVVILFGLHTTGILRIKYLMYEKRMHPSTKPLNIFGSIFVGMAFGIGWTPCIGPVLGTILAVAATRDSLRQGILLLAGYSAGMALPFLLTGLAVNSFLRMFQKVRKYMRIVSAVSGLLLITIGVLLILDRFNF